MEARDPCVLYENYEDFLESLAAERQSDPEITLDTANVSAIKVGNRDEPASQEVVLLRKHLEDCKAQMKKKDEELKAQENEMAKLRSCLVKERREKTEAIKKLAAISLISNSQCPDVKNEGEYFEDVFDSSVGVKKEGVEKFDADAASVKVKREVDSPEQLPQNPPIFPKGERTRTTAYPPLHSQTPTHQSSQTRQAR